MLSENYSSVSPGEKLAWFNAAGFLEISVNKGNMAGLFGLRGLPMMLVRYKTNGFIKQYAFTLHNVKCRNYR